ncbi:shikimate dehydrogenase [Inquilinus ginsengisoli]|uniref:Shikimate dehydrogenase (NADP(+)) n=1 Tax=Inquilinus ginsengisoli TaxID=363840 RepID=A0ABU1JYH7_9PROT|nr:shikimate dehydrogenase [Inquilinus ginsengisoli]MDR6293687.1 shikimate dehydrogenase [Inquilinus ginsengisoli]
MLTAKGRLAGVIGWPVGHSRSPQLHGHWLARHGIDGAYVPLAVAPDRLEAALRGLPALGFRGCNVTVPHKEAAMALVDELDPLARRIAAVNTIVVREDGSLFGTNTDGFGFLANLQAGAPAWSAGQGPAVVIGAGGASRAIIVALTDAGAPEIRLANRTRARAEKLAAELGGPITVIDWADRAAALDGAALLVNTTTEGMQGHAALDLPLDALPRAALVNDIVYVPLETPLLAAARARGHQVVDGIGMLLHQARPGFEAWFGVAPAVDAALRAAVLGPGQG